MRTKKFSVSSLLAAGVLAAAFTCPAVNAPVASAICGGGGGFVPRVGAGGGGGGNCGDDEYNHGVIVSHWCDVDVPGIIHFSSCHDRFADGMVRDCGGGGLGINGGGGCTDPHP